jgi:MoaA/NifB/PqqE/SkfB family radical SAM enzyme
MIKYSEIRQMHIELTSKCQAACPGCPRNVSGGYDLPWLDKKEWTFSQFKKSFPAELLERCGFILFCGNYGDPGTCKDLIEIVDYIKKINWNGTLRIHTNGGMRTPTFWANLASVMNPVTDRVIWSIDGLQDTNHIYRKNVEWDKLINNVKSYLSSGGSATWEYLIFGHNQHQIKTAEQLSIDLGFKEFVYKKAFGFTEERYGKGVSGIKVLDKNGDVDYIIPAPDEEWLNSNTLEVIYNNGESELNNDSFSPKSFMHFFNKNSTNLNEDLKNGQLSWLDHVKEIDCMSIRNKEIFVDSLGGVHPCCFLGHVSQNADGVINMQYYDWIKSNIGFENINIHNHSIEHILDNTDYFNKIEETWAIEKHKDGRIAQCTKHCQLINNPIDSLYESVRGKKTSQAT